NRQQVYILAGCCIAANGRHVMSTTTRTKHPEPPTRETSPVTLFSEWIQQGTESFFATQRILLDLVMRQNAMAMNSIRERLVGGRPTIANAVTEMAGEGVSNFIAAQK